MKRLQSLLVCTLIAWTASAQTQNPQFDSTLAQSLGADPYGMKTYVLVILKTGENKDSVQRDSCFRGHLDNIHRLVDSGLLVVAGPLMRNESGYRGIFILQVSTLEEAREIVQTDPAIHAGYLQADLYLWYGSAALPLYLDEADKIWKVAP